MNGKGLMKIGELARLTGVSVKAIRLYESLGLVRTAGRSSANYRLFPPEAIGCVEAIKSGRKLGLSLKDLEILAEMYQKDPRIEPELLARLLDKARELDERIERLGELRQRIIAFCESHENALRRGGGFEEHWRKLLERARAGYAAAQEEDRDALP